MKLLPVWLAAGVFGCAVLASLSSKATGGPLSNDPTPLAVCQDSIRIAAVRLAAEARRGLSACLTRGIECVVGAPEESAACCTRAAGRCGHDFAKVEQARRKFRTQVAHRRCSDLPFAEVLAGLGYDAVAAQCAGLPRAESLDDLASLTACLDQLVVGGTACPIGTAELPRGAEALGCLGLAEEFASVAATDLGTCAAGPGPSPSASAEATATPAPEPTTTLLAATATAAVTPSSNPTASPIVTPLATASPLVAPTKSTTPTAAPATATRTQTPLPSVTATALPTATRTVTPAPNATTTVLSTATRTATAVPTITATATRTATAVPTITATATRTATAVPTIAATVSAAATAVSTTTPVVATTATRTATPTPVVTATTVAVTSTPVPTTTQTPLPVATSTVTSIPSTPIATSTVVEPTAQVTATLTAVPSSTRTATPAPTITATPVGPFCGNGKKETGENCDDGNNLDCDECPSDCKTAPADCTPAGTTRAPQPIRVIPPAGQMMTSGVICLKYPTGVVGLPGTGLVTQRVSGFAGTTTINDFNNAAIVSFLGRTALSELNLTVSFDLCTGATAPLPTAFSCRTVSATNAGATVPASQVECTPVSAAP